MSEEDKAFLERPGFAGNPFFLRLFAQVVVQMAEDGIIESDVAGAPSAQQMRGRIQEILNDTRWLQGKHPQQAALDEEYRRLMRLANPEPIR